MESDKYMNRKRRKQRMCEYTHHHQSSENTGHSNDEERERRCFVPASAGLLDMTYASPVCNTADVRNYAC